MARDPADTVRAALRIANDSRSVQGQRDAALNRAKHLCETHGLDPDRFDFPGRAKRVVDSTNFRIIEGEGSDAFARAMHEMMAEMRGSREYAEAMSRGGPSMTAARMAQAREALDRELHKRRDQTTTVKSRALRMKAERAAGWLRARGNIVRPRKDGRWSFYDGLEHPGVLTDTGLITAANDRGWR